MFFSIKTLINFNMVDSQKYNKLSSKITPKRNDFNLRYFKKKKKEKWTLI